MAQPSNDPNFPDPAGPKPAGVDDGAWYGYTQVDSTKPLSAWNGWIGEGKYDPTAKGYERFKSSKVDASGNPIQGLYEHPDACPSGTTAYGKNQCLPVNSPQVQGAWNTAIDPKTGKPVAGGGGQSGPQQSPLYQAWDSAGNYHNPPSTPGAGQSPAPENLQGVLQNMFSSRAGTLFGGGHQTAGSLSVDSMGQPLPQGDPRSAKSLSGGGLLWSDNGSNLSDWGGKQPKPGGGGGGGGGQFGSGPQNPFSNVQNSLSGALNQQRSNPYAPPSGYPGPANGQALSMPGAPQTQPGQQPGGGYVLGGRAPGNLGSATAAPGNLSQMMAQWQNQQNPQQPPQPKPQGGPLQQVTFPNRNSPYGGAAG